MQTPQKRNFSVSFQRQLINHLLKVEFMNNKEKSTKGFYDEVELITNDGGKITSSLTSRSAIPKARSYRARQSGDGTVPYVVISQKITRNSMFEYTLNYMTTNTGTHHSPGRSVSLMRTFR